MKLKLWQTVKIFWRRLNNNITKLFNYWITKWKVQYIMQFEIIKNFCFNILRFDFTNKPNRMSRLKKFYCIFLTKKYFYWAEKNDVRKLILICLSVTFIDSIFEIKSVWLLFAEHSQNIAATKVFKCKFIIQTNFFYP